MCRPPPHPARRHNNFFRHSVLDQKLSMNPAEENAMPLSWVHRQDDMQSAADMLPGMGLLPAILIDVQLNPSM